MNKYSTIFMTSIIAVGVAVSSASAFQAAPQSADKAKEMMEKNADKGNSAEAKANAEAKKMAGQAKATAAKSKPKPPKRRQN